MYRQIRSKNFNWYYQNSVRLYHSYSEHGVYGYRKKPEISYKIPNEVLESRKNQSNVYRWVQAYRKHGHRIANVNPVAFLEEQRYIPELDKTQYGLDEEQEIICNGIINTEEIESSIKCIETQLQRLYCGPVSAEFAYIESAEELEWIEKHYETYLMQKLSPNDKKEIAELLLKSQVWDNFLAVKFPTLKRYGGEGAETMMAFFRQIFVSSADNDISHIVLGMPHRGRYNLLTGMLKTRPAKMFRKFKGLPEFPESAKASCDIASHFHVSEDMMVNGKTFRLSMVHNPSHLEVVNPVSMGKTRSKQQMLLDGAFSSVKSEQFGTSVLNIQLHGDAAFPGQGINQEMLMMAGTPHFDVGGTIHMIVNNQVGFTTPSDRGRVSRYCSDLAKSINAPVFHVNGDDPESLTLVTKLAFDYQRQFRKDVFIDFNCFRKWGHNEIDDPTLTNPLQYKIITSRKSIPDTYVEKLIEERIITNEIVDDIVNSHKSFLTSELDNLNAYEPEAYYFKKQWCDIQQASNNITIWDTGIDYQLLRFIGEASIHIPDNFNIHQHLLKTHIKTRLKKLENGTNIDWSTAEAFAIGSLMYQGHNVRISGEDVGRGTFSQRHAMLIDQENNEMYIPLNSLKGGHGGKLEIANSILSEEAVLAFEYGMAIDNPNNLIIWEAQFGDFFNGAQIIIDTYIVSGETKWMYANGLVMLLPHGYDGGASEHSSCRVERFLQQTNSKENAADGDDINLQIINPTTPAQYYHALRRQMIRNFRKPLVVVSPKVLLRLSDATSTYMEFQPGTSFRPVLGDSIADPNKVKKIILCSGKHYYNLNNQRIEKNHSDVAIIRVESLCPFPVTEINEELERYKNVKVCVWSQEEPKNMGYWTFVKPRFENMCGHKIKYYGRREADTPAVGVSSWHKEEAIDVVTGPFNLQ